MPRPHSPAPQLVSVAQDKTGNEDDKKGTSFIPHLWLTNKEPANTSAGGYRRGWIHDRALPDQALEHNGRVDLQPAGIHCWQHGSEHVVRSRY